MLKKPGLEELVRELEREYARWEQVYMAGSKDPFWPDGVNANLCRNHILCGKRRIRELYPDAEMPEIYYRPLPQELPAEYMARKKNSGRLLCGRIPGTYRMKISVLSGTMWSGFLKRMLCAVYWTHCWHGPMF